MAKGIQGRNGETTIVLPADTPKINLIRMTVPILQEGVVPAGGKKRRSTEIVQVALNPIQKRISPMIAEQGRVGRVAGGRRVGLHGRSLNRRYKSTYRRRLRGKYGKIYHYCYNFILCLPDCNTFAVCSSLQALKVAKKMKSQGVSGYSNDSNPFGDANLTEK